ncbi:unnamed protein product [Paramecium pentaurelia]|uniref:Protein-tyrosine-phosphatase n=1 Tax=Paramecium pentaurelia TaxID=43138 RepID=A0A8S1UQB8_9CILI|nr:unnamed protein product [Paramecium pentaurelia]
MNPDYFGCTLIHKSNFPDKGNLYVGGIKSLDSIQKYKFGAIISVIDELDYKIPKQIYHLRIVAPDEPNFKISDHFEKTCKFIKVYLKQTNVLVHCQVGISRSVSVMMAYFIKEMNMKPDDAFLYIQDKREFVHPNEGFRLQLQKFYEECTKPKEKPNPKSKLQQVQQQKQK